MSGGEALAGALEHVEAGIAVNPVTLRLDKHGKKRAEFHTSWREPSGITRDREQVLAWAREFPGCSWAAPCGPNGLVVVDQDVKRDGDGHLVADGRRSWRVASGPRSPMTVRTQSGGEQAYFRAVGEPIRNSARAIEGVPHVDVRGDGGTVFISGSVVHDGGGTYVANRIVPVAELPELPTEWAERLRKAGPRGDRRRSTPRADQARTSRLVGGGSVHDAGWIEAKVDDELRELVRRGQGDFRVRLFRAAAIAYRGVEAGVLVEDEVDGRLRAAIVSVWGAEPDRDDRQWLTEAREAAAGDPWRVAAGPGPLEGGERPSADAAPATESAPPGTLPTLPAAFWSSRPVLEHIRDAAHARAVSADLVLHATLCRLASLQHHETRIDTGLGASALNLFTAVVGPSGAGKSTGFAVAADLLPADESRFSIVGGDGYRDGLPIGSGEGLAELYMGTREEPTGEVYRGGPNKGEDRTRSVRGQVRHNALVYVDEGEALFRMTERRGATISATLRSAWSGNVLGQANASAETTRVIPAGSYALGLVIGVQVDTAAPLFDDAAGGTPQRFLFASATDPAIPDEGPEPRGPLEGVEPGGSGAERVLPLIDPEVKARLRAEHLARHRGQAEHGDPLDAHRPLHVAKVAALLAILDGRRKVDGDDWQLSEQVWTTSVEVRAALLARGREIERERGEQRTAQYVEREQRAALARDQASAKVVKLADRLRGWVADGEHAKAGLRRRLPHRDRGLYDDAVEHAVDAGWLVRTAAGLELGEASS